MPLKTYQDEMPQLNLTPMIDVVFLLIVFFMCAAKFSDLERNIDLRLPQVAQAEAASAAPKARQIAVYPDGRLALDKIDVTLGELSEQLAAAVASQPGLSVIILGDAGCPFQRVAETLAACKDAGVTQLAVSVQVAQGASSERR